jgi:23S rRNA (pseudouridine1915-N3)-methyltransferase
LQNIPAPVKITFLQVGKTEETYLREGIAVYAKRLVHYVPFEEKVLPPYKGAKTTSREEIKKWEGATILKAVSEGDVLILLDEKGKSYSSPEFSGFIQQKMNAGTRHLIFLVGGAFGFSEEVYARANAKISLSQLTFSHQMVRLFFTEQLYRAFTIIKGEKYHHD